jgi:hypothetical protein
MQSILITSKDLNKEFLAGKQIVIKSFHNTYVRAFPGGADQRVDLQTKIESWEKFTLFFRENNFYSFQTFHGSFLRAWPKNLRSKSDCEIG